MDVANSQNVLVPSHVLLGHVLSVSIRLLPMIRSTVCVLLSIHFLSMLLTFFLLCAVGAHVVSQYSAHVGDLRC